MQDATAGTKEQGVVEGGGDGGKLVNTTIKSYPDVSQFWHYDPRKFLAQPVYSRDYPPLKS